MSQGWTEKQFSPDDHIGETIVLLGGRRLVLSIGALAYVAALVPVASPASAQSWEGSRTCRGLEGRRLANCERERERERSDNRWERDRHADNNYDRRERERKKRKDAKKDGVVQGVVGAVVVGGIVAAIASSGNKKKKDRERRGYCENRYGNYDEKSDSYRASNGRWYRCE